MRILASGSVMASDIVVIYQDTLIRSDWKFSFLECIIDFLFSDDPPKRTKGPETRRSKEDEQRWKGPKIHPDDTPIGKAFSNTITVGELQYGLHSSDTLDAWVDEGSDEGDDCF